MNRMHGQSFHEAAGGMMTTGLVAAVVFALSAFVPGQALAQIPQQAKLTADDGLAGDFFGIGVAICGDTAVAGASDEDHAGSLSGAAYVFTRSGAAWTQQAKLVADDAAAGDRFGYSVSIYGDTAVVGAFGDDSQAGSAYVFTRSGAVWTQQAKLVADDAAAEDYFGVCVSIFGDTIVVGSTKDDDAGADSGSAYVFTRSGAAWTQQAKLVADDAAAGDRMGNSVAIFEDTIVVSAPWDADAGAQSGSAYVFTRGGAAWTQQAKLVADDAAAGDNFGDRLSLYGDTVIIPSMLDDDAGADSGSAYVFTRSGAVWTQQAKLVADDGAAGDEFGVCAAVAGDTVVVAARYHDVSGKADAGASYIFRHNGATWTQRAKLTAYDANTSDRYGRSVAISGDTVLVGADKDDDKGSNSGSAYVYRILYPVAFRTDGTPGASLTGETAQTAVWGDGCSPVTANAPANYLFVGWTGDYAGLDNPLIVTSVTADMVITANFAPPDEVAYLTTVVSGNGTVEPDAGAYAVRKGSPVSVTASPIAGSQFIRWAVAGDGAVADSRAPATTATLAGDAVVVAIFATDADTAALTVLAGANGSVSPDGSINVVKGQNQSISATPVEGYHFTGWAGTLGAAIANTAAAATTVSLGQDATVTASFAINTYTVTFDLDGKGARTGGGALEQTIDHGSTAVAPTVDGNAGWVFTGWDVPFNNITGPLTVTAQYEVATYALTYTAGANGLVNGAAQVTQLVAHGSDGPSVAAQPDTGHHFVDWSDASTANPRQDASVTGDITVTANFAINEYRVEFVTDGTEGATLTGDLVQTIAHGGVTAPVLAVPPDAHAFVAWSGGYAGTANPLTVTVTSAMTIVANFQVDQAACGSKRTIEAADIEGLPIGGVFRFKPKVYATYALNGKPGKATAKVLTRIDKVEWPDTIACEWTRKLRLYDAKAFRASEAGGVGAAGWITEATMADLLMDLRLVSKEAPDQSVQPLALAVPVIADIADGGLDEDGNDLLVITGRWFGTKKPKVWREHTVPGKVEGTFVVKRQVMKVGKPTEADALLGFKDSKGKPAHMNAENGESKVVVIVPAKLPNGILNGTIVLDNGVGMAAGGVAVGIAPGGD